MKLYKEVESALGVFFLLYAAGSEARAQSEIETVPGMDNLQCARPAVEPSYNGTNVYWRKLPGDSHERNDRDCAGRAVAMCFGDYIKNTGVTIPPSCFIQGGGNSEYGRKWTESARASWGRVYEFTDGDSFQDGGAYGVFGFEKPDTIRGPATVLVAECRTSDVECMSRMERLVLKLGAGRPGARQAWERHHELRSRMMQEAWLQEGKPPSAPVRLNPAQIRACVSTSGATCGVY